MRDSLASLLALSLLVAAALPACAAPKKEKKAEAAPAVETQVPAQGGQDVIARIGETEIKMAELQALTKADEMQLQNQIYELRVRALDQMISDRLLEAAAKDQGITPDELTKREVTDKVAEVTDADVKEFFESNKNRMPQSATIEQIGPRIKEYLKQQREVERRTAFSTELRDKAKVRILLEPIRIQVSEASGHALGGGTDAPVQIIEFSDFQCPFCTRVLDTIKQIEDTYGKNVRVVFRHFPLEMHRSAQKAAEAANCAGDQGKFWEMHDTMFKNQTDLSVEALKKLAGGIGVDQKKFDECLDGDKKAEEVKKDFKDGQEYGVRGTPAFFVNGRFLSGAQPFESFRTIINDELERKGIEPPKPKPAEQAAAPAQPAAAEKQPAAKPKKTGSK